MCTLRSPSLRRYYFAPGTIAGDARPGLLRRAWRALLLFFLDRS